MGGCPCEVVMKGRYCGGFPLESFSWRHGRFVVLDMWLLDFLRKRQISGERQLSIAENVDSYSTITCCSVNQKQRKSESEPSL